MGRKISKNRQIIIDRTKELYLSINIKGVNNYTYREIMDVIFKEFGGEKISFSNINYWKKKYNWDEKQEEIKEVAIAKIEHLPQDATHDEIVVEVRSKAMLDTYMKADELSKMAAKGLNDAFDGIVSGLLKPNELIMLYKVTSDIKQKLLMPFDAKAEKIKETFVLSDKKQKEIADKFNLTY